MKDRMEVKVTSEDINTQADTLTDLPVNEGQAEETKAGGFSAYGGFIGGVRVANSE